MGGRKNFINVYKYLKRRFKDGSVKLFSVVPSAKARENGHKLEHRNRYL